MTNAVESEESSRAYTNMDPLSDLVAFVQPRSYAAGGLSAGGHWGVRFPAHGMIKCYSVIKGECWLTVDGVADSIRLQTGSSLLLTRGWPFSLASRPSQPLTSMEVRAGQQRYNGIVPVNHGNDFLILGSHFRLESDARFLMDALPPVVLLEDEAQRESLRWAVDRLLREMRDPQPGTALIAQQIAQMVLVEAFRLHVAADIERDPGWLAALGDVRLRAALTAMHREPARAWTLADLARSAAMSRTAFAQHFKARIGMPPMEYLTRWRMRIAARRLQDPRQSVASVAAAVGYRSESAFSAAFKRVRGSSPRQHPGARHAVQDRKRASGK